MGSQRVRHDWGSFTFTFTVILSQTEKRTVKNKRTVRPEIHAINWKSNVELAVGCILTWAKLHQAGVENARLAEAEPNSSGLSLQSGVRSFMEKLGAMEAVGLQATQCSRVQWRGVQIGDKKGRWARRWTSPAAAAAAAKSLQSCPTLCDPIDGSPPGSPVPGILQARILEWVAISFSNSWKWKVNVKSLSCVRLLATPWTVAYQAPPSMGFARQEYWSGVPLPSPAAAAAKSFQSCPTPWDPIDDSPPGSPIPGILQARTLEWVAISFSNAWKRKVKVKSLSHKEGQRQGAQPTGRWHPEVPSIDVFTALYAHTHPIFIQSQHRGFGGCPSPCSKADILGSSEKTSSSPSLSARLFPPSLENLMQGCRRTVPTEKDYDPSVICVTLVQNQNSVRSSALACDKWK